MKKILSSLLLATVITLAACSHDRITGSGPTGTEERSVNNFTRVRTSGSSNVTVNQGPQFKVEVKGYNNLIPYFETRVISGTLEVGYKNNTRVKNDNIEVFVTLPVLEGLAISGSANITANGTFTSNHMDATISGSGGIDIKQGTTENFNANISGSGNISAFGVTAKKSTVRISGSGNIKTTTTDELTVNISGSGNVYYKGSPSITTNISGSGSLIKE